jgi:hypothetical protein
MGLGEGPMFAFLLTFPTILVPQVIGDKVLGEEISFPVSSLVCSLRWNLQELLKPARHSWDLSGGTEVL